MNLLNYKLHCSAPKRKGIVSWTQFAEEVIGKISMFMDFNEVDSENLHKKVLQLMCCSKETS